MFPLSLSIPAPLFQLEALRPEPLSFAAKPDSDLFVGEELKSTNLDKLKSLKSYTHAHKAFQDILETLKTDENIQTAQSALTEFHEASADLLLDDIPICHKLYYHIWNFSHQKDPAIHGDHWGEIHAFEDLDILIKSMQAVSFQLFTRRISEQVDRLDSPIRKARSDILDDSMIALSAEYTDLIDRFMIFLKDPSSDSGESMSQILAKIRVDSPSWAKRKKHIVSSCEEAHRHPLINKPLFWITGSNSHSLAGVMHAKELAEFDHTPSLIPTGVLLSSGIAPLSGELGDGITEKGVNQKHLSGVLAEAFEGAVSYALNSELYFDKKLSTTALFELISELNHKKFETIALADLLRCKCLLIRAYQFGDLADESFLIIKATLTTWYNANKLSPQCQLYMEKDFLPFLQNIKKMTISANLASIVAKKASPLLYGISCESDEVSEKINRRIRGDVRLETSLRGPLQLGDLVDFAISSDPEAASILNEILKYKVLSFDAGRYLLSRQNRVD